MLTSIYHNSSFSFVQFSCNNFSRKNFSTRSIQIKIAYNESFLDSTRSSLKRYTLPCKTVIVNLFNDEHLILTMKKGDLRYISVGTIYKLILNVMNNKFLVYCFYLQKCYVMYYGLCHVRIEPHPCPPAPRTLAL